MNHAQPRRLKPHKSDLQRLGISELERQQAEETRARLAVSIARLKKKPGTTYQARSDGSVPQRSRTQFEKHIPRLSIFTLHLYSAALDPPARLLARFEYRDLALWKLF